VRKLQEIAWIGSSGRSSPGSGGRWWCSAGIHEGEWAAGGRRWQSRCGERWGGSGARVESDRSGDGRMSGRGRWPHSARRRHGAWPRPEGGASTVSRLAVTRMRRARATRRCSDSGTLAPTGRALVAVRAGRCGWCAGARGPAREESGVAEPR
jgi:hypothetical protein